MGSNRTLFADPIAFLSEDRGQSATGKVDPVVIKKNGKVRALLRAGVVRCGLIDPDLLVHH